jgi:hypothetical protein
MANHNDSSRWFAISSSHLFAVLVSVLWVRLHKSKLNLDVRNIFARSNTEHLWRCWYVIEYIVYDSGERDGCKMVVGFWWEGSEPQMFRVEGAHSLTYHGCVPENSGLIVRDATGVFFVYMHSSTILLSYLCGKLKLIPQ